MASPHSSLHGAEGSGTDVTCPYGKVHHGRETLNFRRLTIYKAVHLPIHCSEEKERLMDEINVN